MSSPCRARINQSADVSNSNVKVKRRTEVPNYSEKNMYPSMVEKGGLLTYAGANWSTGRFLFQVCAFEKCPLTL
jgi:hypothetical protein